MEFDNSVRDAAARTCLPVAAAEASCPLPSGYRLPFFAPFRYSPRGVSSIAQRSRRLRDLAKRADPITLAIATTRVAKLIAAGAAPDFFAPDVLFIPVPRRVPQRPCDASSASNARNAPEAIARALLAIGLGDSLWPALRRHRAIPKSAWSRPGSRPEFLAHFSSLVLIRSEPTSLRFLLVDDFVTRGRTLLSAAAVLYQNFPRAHIRAFALVRTEGLNPDITTITAPAIGVIRYLGGDAFRSP